MFSRTKEYCNWFCHCFINNYDEIIESIALFHDDNEAMKSSLSTKCGVFFSFFYHYVLQRSVHFFCQKLKIWAIHAVVYLLESVCVLEQPARLPGSHSLLGNQPVIKLFSVHRELGADASSLIQASNVSLFTMFAPLQFSLLHVGNTQCLVSVLLSLGHYCNYSIASQLMSLG